MLPGTPILTVGAEAESPSMVRVAGPSKSSAARIGWAASRRAFIAARSAAEAARRWARRVAGELALRAAARLAASQPAGSTV